MKIRIRLERHEYVKFMRNVPFSRRPTILEKLIDMVINNELYLPDAKDKKYVSCQFDVDSEKYEEFKRIIKKKGYTMRGVILVLTAAYNKYVDEN